MDPSERLDATFIALADPTRTYLMSGTNGLINVAKRNNIGFAELPQALSQQGIDYRTFRDEIRRAVAAAGSPALATVSGIAAAGSLESSTRADGRVTRRERYEGGVLRAKVDARRGTLAAR